MANQKMDQRHLKMHCFFEDRERRLTHTQTLEKSYTQERPSLSRGPKGRKNSLADRTFNQTSADTGSILSSSINHSLTLTICKYIGRNISHFRSQTLSCWEHLLLSFNSESHQAEPQLLSGVPEMVLLHITAQAEPHHAPC